MATDTEVVEAEAPPISGDVDISTLSTKKQKGEVVVPYPVGYWVVLGEHDSVPEELQGHIACITSSPLKPVPFASGEEVIHGYNITDQDYTVKTRDSADATLVVPGDAFSAVADSRPGLQGFA